jgi:hypothetical protein
MHRQGSIFALLLLAGAGLASPLCAQQPPRPDTLPDYILGTLVVEGRIDDLTQLATSASQGRVGAADLRLRPLSREGELLETVPGFIATQHSGDGKGNQMFVRASIWITAPTSSPGWRGCR